MSARKDGERETKAAAQASGVLSNLPRTRPQRPSARRVAARQATATQAAEANGSSAREGDRAAAAKATKRAQRPRGAGAGAPKRARTTTARSASAPAGAGRAPRQGFECEGERASGTVHPPGGAELVASAAEIVGELAKAGLSTGERVLKDVLSRLPL
jgi:hypothetical protein